MWVAMSGCYAPSLRDGAPCDPVMNNCLIGETCVAIASNGGVCMAGGRSGSSDGPEAGSGSGRCLGGHLLSNVCLTRVPTQALTLTGTTTINAMSTGSGGCTEILPQRDGPALCVVAATSIVLSESATLRGVSVVPAGMTINGTNALVLVALDAIAIAGTIDVSTHNETIGGDPVVGPGARTAAGCLALGIDGQPGSGSFGGAGGAGGSFGGAGGLGGHNNNNNGRGTPVAAATPTVVMGGCPGGHGGAGAGGSLGGGAGGGAGGAVYLIAGRSITIAGTINASGAGGRGGNNGVDSSGAGGGGGAGGMIGVEADRLVMTDEAVLFANGGGGGAGAGNMNIGVPGGPGADPTTATVAAGGGTATNGGGAGGIGSFGATLNGAAGTKGGGSQPQSGGGGGGGGAGVIQIFANARVLNGTLSPAVR